MRLKDNDLLFIPTVGAVALIAATVAASVTMMRERDKAGFVACVQLCPCLDFQLDAGPDAR